ncbi:2-oxo-4-hydroxy-4-carboxy--5-ureidoimidazoline (OHCU) decarboxylase [Serinicoccus hydrothermalis]|uniref:2-oxo-4-hydroxy-4-carboxy-5-ureidoimidazoline decarboxylase n=1 Tax=Serinicoccus hydrothermalis TaxID=1758689 RepID=A0A1B1NDT5_9MICO|nr:2-oxo-4-hydroxy-4-carboxy-5-ureidoimidazoline decarboxylase [Serinicoccus hydrothermalis]ANS79584.1 2-oxo-4-hydroxy-4-carboxy--5-ureidoimidazoline (OHCU) decarboxylase [Serinicoccus hydrothermalis]
MAQQPSDETDDALDLTAWQALGPHAARETLLSCCSSPRWADAVVQGRPYAGVEELLEASDDAFGSLTAEDVADALAGHPRIGERASGSGRDARFSQSEQSAVAGSAQDVQDRLRAGNQAYEQRFDRVFLIRAAGRGPEEILTELERRLTNDDETETAEVVEQLRQITRRRLQELIHP